MLNWVDVVIAVIFAAGVIWETRRGFGRAIFDFAALLVAVKLSPMISQPLSHAVRLVGSTHTNEALWYSLTFAVLGGVLLLVGKFVYSTTLVSAEVFDALLGGLFGVGISIVLCHAFVRVIALHAGSADIAPPMLVSSAFGSEFLTFDSYHQLLEAIYRFRSSSE